MLKELRKESFVLGERNNTIANIAWREHVQLFLQASAGTTVVAHSDDSTKFADTRLPRLRCWRRVLLKSLQECGEAGATADCNNSKALSFGVLMPARAL